MASTHLLHLLVIFLGFSHLIISLNAIPVTRIESLKHGLPTRLEDHIAGNNNLVNTENNFSEQMISERMDVELHDYPGSGANNRHTPRAQLARCADC